MEPPPDASQACVGEPAGGSLDLGARLAPNHRLQFTHHGRIGMRARHGSENVVGGPHVGHPVAHGFVHGVFQGRGAVLDRVDLGPQQVHAKHVERLALHIDRAHVDFARKPEQGGHRGGGHAVLASPGLRDDTLLVEALGQQNLAHAVVQLVRAGVAKILALEKHAQAAALGPCHMLGQARRLGQRRGPADILAQQPVQLGAEGRVAREVLPGVGQLFQSRHQGFGDVAPAVGTKSTGRLGNYGHLSGATICLGVLPDSINRSRIMSTKPDDSPSTPADAGCAQTALALVS